MNRRLLAAVGVYGVVAPAVVVGVVYTGMVFLDRPFGPVGVLTVLVGLIVGPFMFARAGSAPAAAGGEGESGGGIELEHETDTFVEAGSGTPLQARVGLFLLGAAVISALFLAVG